MVRTCGIHIDRDHVRVVALEGGAKKHKVVFHDEEPIQLSVGAALKELGRRNKLQAEDVGLAVDSGIAAFRKITLPFDDNAKIEEVIKYEIENELPQWDIDDVIVDFLVTNSRSGVSSELVVCAVPKLALGGHIEALSKAGLEPAEAELDGSAVFDAALAAGDLDPEAARVLVHVGDATTIVAVADGHRLVSLRALRVGAMAVKPDETVLESEAPLEALEETDEAVELTPPEPAGPSEAELRARVQQIVTRLRREIMRTVTGARTEHEFDAVLLAGHQLDELDIQNYGDLSVRWVGAENGQLPPESMVAYGAALHQLGAGVLKPRLRREELRFTGTLERLELPLAVFSMLLFAFLFTQFVIARNHLGWRDEGKPAKNQPGDMQIWLEASLAYLLPKEGVWPGHLERPPEELTAYAAKALAGEDEVRTKFQELEHVQTLLREEIFAMQRDLGQVSEISLPLSAFKGGVLVLDVIDRMRATEAIPRFSVRGLDATYVSNNRSGDSVLVDIDLDFWGESSLEATRHFNDFKAELERQPWSTSVEARNVRSVEGQPVVYVDGMKIEVDPTKSEAGGA